MTPAIGSDDDIPDPLEHKPMGRCPWCDRKLFPYSTADRFPLCTTTDCDYDNMESQESNRTRYAEEVLDDAYTEGRIIGDQRKYGAGREV